VLRSIVCQVRPGFWGPPSPGPVRGSAIGGRPRARSIHPVHPAAVLHTCRGSRLISPLYTHISNSIRDIVINVRDEGKRGVTCGFTVRAMGGRVRGKSRKPCVTSRYDWAGHGRAGSCCPDRRHQGWFLRIWGGCTSIRAWRTLMHTRRARYLLQPGESPTLPERTVPQVLR